MGIVIRHGIWDASETQLLQECVSDYLEQNGLTEAELPHLLRTRLEDRDPQYAPFRKTFISSIGESESHWI
jgi:predicted transcriptional regulator